MSGARTLSNEVGKIDNLINNTGINRDPMFPRIVKKLGIEPATPSIKDKIEAGELGIKTGKGLYSHLGPEVFSAIF